jgi:hypothetical protein
MATARCILFPGFLALAVASTACPGFAVSQERAQQPGGGQIEREKLFLAGWDPDEPVPAFVYYQKGHRALPVVIFLHGLGGS